MTNSGSLVKVLILVNLNNKVCGKSQDQRTCSTRFYSFPKCSKHYLKYPKPAVATEIILFKLKILNS